MFNEIKGTELAQRVVSGVILTQMRNHSVVRELRECGEIFLDLSRRDSLPQCQPKAFSGIFPTLLLKSYF